MLARRHLTYRACCVVWRTSQWVASEPTALPSDTFSLKMPAPKSHGEGSKSKEMDAEREEEVEDKEEEDDDEAAASASSFAASASAGAGGPAGLGRHRDRDAGRIKPPVPVPLLSPTRTRRRSERLGSIGTESTLVPLQACSPVCTVFACCYRCRSFHKCACDRAVTRRGEQRG
jgi:hypothetical protein